MQLRSNRTMTLSLKHAFKRANLASLQKMEKGPDYTQNEIDFWRTKYETLKAQINEVKEQRRLARNENLAMQKEIKRHNEKIQELERVINHFNLGRNEVDSPMTKIVRKSLAKNAAQAAEQNAKFFTP
jgi:peptidoglycan hydrolase CwlO-like protein